MHTRSLVERAAIVPARAPSARARPRDPRAPAAVTLALPVAALLACASAPPPQSSRATSELSARCAPPPVQLEPRPPGARSEAAPMIVIDETPLWRRCCERSVPALVAFADAAPAADGDGSEAPVDERDEGRLRALLARERAAFEVCYACARVARSDVAGTAAYRVVWDARRRPVALALARDQVGDPTLHRCVLAALQRVRFPAASEGSVRQALVALRFDPGVGVVPDPPGASSGARTDAGAPTGSSASP